MKQLIIIGAGGHGKVVADIAKKNGYRDISFLDDKDGLMQCGQYPVIGKNSTFKKFNSDMIVAIGNAEIRKRFQQNLETAGKSVVTLIHPNAVIGENVVIGRGTVVMAGAVINPGSAIGKGCIINTCSSVDHDCKVADYAHISVDAHLAGTVFIGEGTLVGIGSTVSSNLKVCRNCTIGAGAVVVKDITESGVYIGVPARLKT